ncbi:MAG: DUF4175 family protein [Myxococcota bacterium]
MGSASNTLDLLLRRTRRHLRTYALVEVALGASTGAVVGLAVTLVVIEALPFSLGLRTSLWALLGASTLAGAAMAFVRRWLPLSDDFVLATHLEAAAFRRGAALGDAVRSAVQLRESAKPDPFQSRALADAHIRSTLQRLDASTAVSSLGGVALSGAVPALLSFSIAVSGAGLVWLTLPDVVADRLSRLFDDDTARAALERRAAAALPLVTDLQLTLRFPAYMGRDDVRLEGASGDISAPRGTEVTVDGRSDRPVREASLLLGDQALGLVVEGERRLRGRFVIDREGSYRFRLLDSSGDTLLDPVARRITLVADEVPEVTLEAPVEDRVVQLEENIELLFQATDDYGVTRARLVIHRQGTGAAPFHKDLTVVEERGRLEVRERGSFTIAETGARAGDKLSVYVEAFDNDTVSGPKAGRSPTRVLTVFSELEHHRRLIELEERLLDRAVHVLGDELEHPLAASLQREETTAQLTQLSAQETVVTHEGELLGLLDEILREVQQDRLTAEDVRRALSNMRAELAVPFQQKKETLQSTRSALEQKRPVVGYVWRQLESLQTTAVERLERHVLYLEDLLNTQRLKEAEELGKELRRTQQDLKELIAQYRQSPDDDKRQRIMEEIQRLRDQLRELGQRLAKVQRDIPDEYLNQESFETREMMQEAMDLDRLIEEGKLEDAAAALERMVEQTEKMLEGIEENQEEYGGEEYRELREKLERFGQELSALEAAQQELLERTEEKLEAARREAERRLAGKLQDTLQRLAVVADKAQQRLAGVEPEGLFVTEQEDAALAEARAADLKQALEQRDLEDALAAAEEAAAAARATERALADRTKGRYGSRNKATLDAKERVGDARPLLEEIAAELRKLEPDPVEMLPKSQRAEMKREGKAQRELEQRGQDLQGKMDELAKELPIFGPQHQQRVRGATQEMRRASQMLGGERPREARAAQQQALEGLRQLREALEQQQGQGGGRGGLPLPLPGGASGNEPSGQEGDGRRGAKDEVKIPGAEEFRVPDAFRKDILDAMREGAPEEWQGEVKRYYEELVK